MHLSHLLQIIFFRLVNHFNFFYRLLSSAFFTTYPNSHVRLFLIKQQPVLHPSKTFNVSPIDRQGRVNVKSIRSCFVSRVGNNAITEF